MNNESEASMEQNLYSLYIDYAKALGIFFVVMGHYYSPPIPVFNPYIFHMPLFFFIGGILFNPKKEFAKVFKKVVKSHLLYLAIIYVSIGIISKIISSLTGVKISDGLYLNPIETLTKAYNSNMSESRLFLVSWFLLSYAFVSLAASLLHNLLRKISLNHASKYYLMVTFISGIASMNYLPALYVEHKVQALNLLCQIGVGLMFYSAGYASRSFLYKNLSIIGSFFLFIIAAYLVRKNMLHMNFMVWSKYPDGVIITLFGSIAGIYIVLFFAKALSCMRPSKVLLHIGRNTKTIMSWHLLSFLLIDLSLSHIGLFDFKSYNSGGYHVFNAPSLWGVYMLGGMFIPLSFLWVGNRIIRRATMTKDVH